MDKKVFKIYMLCLGSMGWIAFLLSLFLRNSIGDFMKGFLDGIAVTLILGWTVYMLWPFVKGKNPYKEE